ncbi:MAG: hypothetical protein WDO71_20105 [Bacteroidota bacterium]
MQKSYKEILGEIFEKWHKDLMDQGFKIAELLDKVIVWLIGLSTGAIVLIFSSLDKLIFVSKHTINTTLSFLVCAIVLGVVGRVLYAIAIYLGFFMSSLFSMQLRMLEVPHDPRIVDDEDTSEDIYGYFLEDFKIDMPSLLEYKKSVAENNWSQAHKYARDLYNDYAELSRLKFQDAMKVITKITTDSFGYEADYFEKKKTISNRKKGKILRFLTTFSYALYISSALAFGTAVLYFFLQYLNS